MTNGAIMIEYQRGTKSNDKGGATGPEWSVSRVLGTLRVRR